MPAPDLPPDAPPVEPPVKPRERTWPAFATVGFFAGVLTVVLAVVFWRRWFGD